MKHHFTLTTEPINEATLLGQRRVSDGAGAVVHFLGVVRGDEAGQRIAGLEYEAFERMAKRQFERIFAEIAKRWPAESVRVVHRVGCVKVNEPSIWVEVVAPHRAEAFAACQYLIDEMKRLVPIWKKPVG